MTDNYRWSRLSAALWDLSDQLDVPPSKYREAKDRYEAVGSWLGAHDSELAAYGPVVSPQGSFAVGTAVRPPKDGEYDVDSVCVLQTPPRGLTQERLKNLVGDRLKHPSSRYKQMLVPPDGGRRCWTIQYADESRFHMDILPAVPDDPDWLMALGVPKEFAESALCITDRMTWHVYQTWPRSNPKGYAGWFKLQMRVLFEEARRALAMEQRAEVEAIEDFEIRTPLQRLVQILKRDRDVRFGNDEDKPVSIIISTLAAQAYRNERDLAEALLNVVKRMRSGIELRGDVWWVQNPVNPRENFADKWQETPRKAEVFLSWLTDVEQEVSELLTDEGWDGLGRYLPQHFGERDADATMARVVAREAKARAAGRGVPTVLAARKSDRPSMPAVTLPSKPGRPWRP